VIATNLLKYKYLQMETYYLLLEGVWEHWPFFFLKQREHWLLVAITSAGGSIDKITRHVKLVQQGQAPKVWKQMFSSNQDLALDQQQAERLTNLVVGLYIR
jgi:hypothetical protein